MAYNEQLEDRINAILKKKRVRFEAKNMMGGLCYLVNDKMCVGITKDDLMARIDPSVYEASIKKKGCRPMDFTGRPMRGYVYVDEKAIEMEDDLETWIDLALEFNPKAKSSKKKK